MFNEFISELGHQLNLDLPGRDAHQLMASSITNFPELFEHQGRQPSKSAVLVLLYLKNNEIYSVLIQRPQYQGHHSGQVSFPGGKTEKNDHDLTATALRESYEEIGIIPDKIRISGMLSMFFIPISNMEVYPIVGWIDETPVFKTDTNEVEAVIEYPLRFLFDPSLKKAETLTFKNLRIRAPFYDINGYHVWGATAMIISEFSRVLKNTGFFDNNE
ncbi:MAG: CoA pyrophosphatase [Bacteroidota bacterium]